VTHTPPVRSLVIRIEQLASPEPSAVSVEPGPVAFRIDGVPVCAAHAHELPPFLPPDRKARRVLEDDAIESLVVEFGLDRDDIRRLHGRRLGEECALCPVMYVEGNTCGSCDRPLHPKWPAIYCSNECALRDL
jgi:hypothetical protein